MHFLIHLLINTLVAMDTQFMFERYRESSSSSDDGPTPMFKSKRSNVETPELIPGSRQMSQSREKDSVSQSGSPVLSSGEEEKVTLTFKDIINKIHAGPTGITIHHYYNIDNVFKTFQHIPSKKIKLCPLANRLFNKYLNLDMLVGDEFDDGYMTMDNFIERAMNFSMDERVGVNDKIILLPKQSLSYIKTSPLFKMENTDEPFAIDKSLPVELHPSFRYIVDSLFFQIIVQMAPIIQDFTSDYGNMKNNLNLLKIELIERSSFPLLFEIFTSANDFCIYVDKEGVFKFENIDYSRPTFGDEKTTPPIDQMEPMLTSGKREEIFNPSGLKNVLPGGMSVMSRDERIPQFFSKKETINILPKENRLNMFSKKDAPKEMFRRRPVKKPKTTEKKKNKTYHEILPPNFDKFSLYEIIQFILDLYIYLGHWYDPTLSKLYGHNDWFNGTYAGEDYLNIDRGKNFCDRFRLKKQFEEKRRFSSTEEYQQETQRLLFRNMMSITTRISLLSLGLWNRGLSSLYSLNLDFTHINYLSNLRIIEQHPFKFNLPNMKLLIKLGDVGEVISPLDLFNSSIDYLLVQLWEEEQVTIRKSWKIFKHRISLKRAYSLILDSAVNNFLISSIPHPILARENLNILGQISFFINFISSLQIDPISLKFKQKIPLIIEPDFVKLLEHFHSVLLPNLADFLAEILMLFPTRASYCSAFIRDNLPKDMETNIKYSDFAMKAFFTFIAIDDLIHMRGEKLVTSDDNNIHSIFRQHFRKKYEKYNRTSFLKFLSLDRHFEGDTKLWWVSRLSSFIQYFGKDRNLWSLWTDLDICEGTVYNVYHNRPIGYRVGLDWDKFKKEYIAVKVNAIS